MNTVTLDDGAKRHFALPAAIVVSAYAGLIFGFVRHPLLPPLDPPISQKTLSPPIILTLSEIQAQSGGEPTPISSSPPPRPHLPEPIHSEPENTLKISVPPISPAGPVSPNSGPWSPGGLPDPVEGLGPQPLDSALLDQPPEVLTQLQPEYPDEAKARAESGKVVVEFVVDESGHVLNPRVISASDAVFEGTTLRAIEQWRFAPGKWHGVPVRFRLNVPVVFHLDE
ncbi:MAG: energy transducer TonB [Opitutaceae bacterium]|jgi:TonB family protein